MLLLLAIAVALIFYLPNFLMVKPFANADQWQQSQRFFLQQKPLSQKATIYHLQDSQCTCTFFSKKHIKLLDEQAQQGLIDTRLIDVQQQNLTQNEQQIIKQVPSLPAVVLADAFGQWRYVGPYSTGLTCSLGNSFVESVLASLKLPTNSNLWLNFFSEGCFCQNPLFDVSNI